MPQGNLLWLAPPTPNVPPGNLRKSAFKLCGKKENNNTANFIGKYWKKNQLFMKLRFESEFWRKVLKTDKAASGALISPSLMIQLWQLTVLSICLQLIVHPDYLAKGMTHVTSKSRVRSSKSARAPPAAPAFLITQRYWRGRKGRDGEFWVAHSSALCHPADTCCICMVAGDPRIKRLQECCHISFNNIIIL